jgi:hypothetical protein
MADFFAKQPAPKPPADAGDPARLERSRAVVAQNHCDGLPSPGFFRADNVPRLADPRDRGVDGGLRNEQGPSSDVVLTDQRQADSVMRVQAP